ncbi:MAG: tripartite tricarboxylate transporter substrate binding protein [Betaproteobacteria bacterium]|nr:MAG: tripartite tricarboxylate transporter substrate binding protein [Betaproteobacteria bacterium]
MRISRLFLITALVLAAGSATAQPYPSKPIRFIVGFSAGSSIDVASRVILEEVRKKTGAVIVVENRPGALGSIATGVVVKAAPDGYTLMPSSSATHSSGPQLMKAVPYDPLKDFTQLAAIFRFDLLLMVSPNQPYKTVADLVAEGKKHPGKLNYGYGSATGQVAASAFSRAAGIETQGVAYKGQPLALNDLMGGQVNFVMVDVAATVPLVNSGKLLALGIASDKRSTIMPTVPTLAELGIKDVELSGWVGIAGPAGMFPEVVTWWTNQVTQALAQKEVVDRLHGMGLEPVTSGLSGEAFAQYVRQQYDVWGRHIRAAGIKPE